MFQLCAAMRLCFIEPPAGRGSHGRRGRVYGEPRKVDIRLPGKGDSNSHGARPVHQKHRWIRTRRLSIKNSLANGEGGGVQGVGSRVYGVRPWA